ncbi:MAG: hypothetical protein P1U46_00090 [Patescibacteria group bacterium]|nr:hypothetical protein [Patescibacteria group bacterium]
MFFSSFFVNNVSAINTCEITESKPYDYIDSLEYSPDSKSYSYIAEKDGKFLLIKD